MCADPRSSFVLPRSSIAASEGALSPRFPLARPLTPQTICSTMFAEVNTPLTAGILARRLRSTIRGLSRDQRFMHQNMTTIEPALVGL